MVAGLPVEAEMSLSKMSNKTLSHMHSLPTGGEDGEVRERDEIRHDRRKERQHDRNISRAAPDKRYIDQCPTESFIGQSVKPWPAQFVYVSGTIISV